MHQINDLSAPGGVTIPASFQTYHGMSGGGGLSPELSDSEPEDDLDEVIHPGGGGGGRRSGDNDGDNTSPNIRDKNKNKNKIKIIDKNKLKNNKMNKREKVSRATEAPLSAPQFAQALVDAFQNAHDNSGGGGGGSKNVLVVGDAYGMHLGYTTLSGINYYALVRESIARHPRRAQFVQDLKLVGLKPEAANNGINNNVMEIYLKELIMVWFNFYIRFLKMEFKRFWLLDIYKKKKYLKKRNVVLGDLVYPNYHELVKDLLKVSGIFMDGWIGTDTRALSAWCQDASENAPLFGASLLSSYWARRGTDLLPALSQRRCILRSMDPGINYYELKNWAIPRSNYSGLAHRLHISADYLESRLQEEKEKKKKFVGNGPTVPSRYSKTRYSGFGDNNSTYHGSSSNKRGWCKFSKRDCPYIRRGNCWYNHAQ